MQIEDWMKENGYDKVSAFPYEKWRKKVTMCSGEVFELYIRTSSKYEKDNFNNYKYVAYSRSLNDISYEFSTIYGNDIKELNEKMMKEIC